ncbi:MAG: TetR/AcrR family transcriptional regulator [Myxococcota bacterium]
MVSAVSSPGSKSGESELRARIIDVATTLFAERGYAATSMRDVASGASCTKPALYYHFDNKEALFLEVIVATTNAVVDLLRGAMGAPGTVRERMQASMHAYFAHLRAHPRALKVMMQAEISTDVGQPTIDFKSMRQSHINLVMPLLREGVDRGEIRADVDLYDALHVIAGAMDARAIQFVLEDEPIPVDYPERILALIFGGLSP